MQRKIGIGLALAFLLTGCATPSKTDKRIQALELKIKKQRERLQDLKERNLVLEKRVKTDRTPEEVKQTVGEVIVQSEPPAELPASFGPAESATTAALLPTKLPAKSEKAGAAPVSSPLRVSSEKTGEHYLYSKILETYRSKSVGELERTRELLLKSYPESVFCDNAIYLSGLLSFELQDFKAALKQFDTLLHDYPRSNKAVAALFAKASIEKRMGRVHDAKQGFLQVRDLYPGSPEAARVSVELKLLESASVKHRES